jgi:hypothetical protein
MKDQSTAFELRCLGEVGGPDGRCACLETGVTVDWCRAAARLRIALGLPSPDHIGDQVHGRDSELGEERRPRDRDLVVGIVRIVDE